LFFGVWRKGWALLFKNSNAPFVYKIYPAFAGFFFSSVSAKAEE
jgi:hypothetical protein